MGGPGQKYITHLYKIVLMEPSTMNNEKNGTAKTREGGSVYFWKVVK